MKKLSGFSLMEMMVVLLIVSVVAAASAPMVNKKLTSAVADKSPWVWAGNQGDIAFNMNGVDTVSASIGSSQVPQAAGGARLYLDGSAQAPQLSFGRALASIANIWVGASTINFSTTNTQAANSTVLGVGATVPDTAHNSVAIGRGAIINNAATNSVGIGQDAIISNAALNTVGIGKSVRVRNANSVAIGRGATISGANSVAIGDDALASTNCIAIGYNALTYTNAIALGGNTESRFSGVAIGSNAFSSESAVTAGNNTTAYANATAIGVNAKSTAQNAISIGRWAEGKSQETVVIGHSANASGEYSIAIGGRAQSTSSNNIAIGEDSRAGERGSIAIGHGAISRRYKSVAIGEYAVASADNQVVLGTQNHTVYIPGRLVVGGTSFLGVNDYARTYVRLQNQDIWGARTGGTGTFRELIQDHSNAADPYVEAMGGPDITTYRGWSDRRLKNVGKAFVGGLNEIKKLEVFNYTFKNDKSKTPRVGVMAQDLQKIFPNAVFKGDDGFLRIRMEDMFYALINAVKELDAKIDLLAQKQKKIDELEDKVTKLEKRLEYLEKKVK